MNVATKVNRADVLPERNDLQETWRLIRRDASSGVGVGIAAFKPLAAGTDVERLCEAHDVPEVHYVLSGNGVLYEDGERIDLRAGDAVVTPAGARHVLYASGADPLVTIYVAIRPSRSPRRSRPRARTGRGRRRDA